MPTNYTHNTERELRSQASLYRACHNRELAGNFTRWADDVKRLKMAVDLHEQGAVEMREELAALKEAVRPVVEYYKWLAVTEEDAFEPGEIIIGSSFQGVTKEQLDALAALVGEE